MSLIHRFVYYRTELVRVCSFHLLFGFSIISIKHIRRIGITRLIVSPSLILPLTVSLYAVLFGVTDKH